MRWLQIVIAAGLLSCNIPHSINDWAMAEDGIRDTSIMGHWYGYNEAHKSITDSTVFIVDTLPCIRDVNGECLPMYTNYIVTSYGPPGSDTIGIEADTVRYQLAYFKIGGKRYLDITSAVNLSQAESACPDCLVRPKHFLYILERISNDTAILSYWSTAMTSDKQVKKSGAKLLAEEQTLYGTTTELRKYLQYISKLKQVEIEEKTILVRTRR